MSSSSSSSIPASTLTSYPVPDVDHQWYLLDDRPGSPAPLVTSRVPITLPPGSPGAAQFSSGGLVVVACVEASNGGGGAAEPLCTAPTPVSPLPRAGTLGREGATGTLPPWGCE